MKKKEKKKKKCCSFPVILEEQSSAVEGKGSQHLACSALVLYHLYCQSEPLLTKSAL